MSAPAPADNALTPAEQAMIDLLKRHGLRDAKAVMSYQGGEDLVKEGLEERRRTRLELKDEGGREHVLFLKRYAGPPQVFEAVARWWRHGWVFSAAQAEARSVGAVRRAGVATMQVVAWQSGAWGSYLITTCVPGEALERQGEEFWRAATAEASRGERLAKGLAEVIRRLHVAGLAHRDLYASHIFLDEIASRLDLYLIDLARTFRPRWRRFRWRVKDLASLHYSLSCPREYKGQDSLSREWIAKWWDAFLREYLGAVPEHEVARWRAAVEKKSARIARRAAKKAAL